MLNLSLNKKRKVLERPKDLSGIFDDTLTVNENMMENDSQKSGSDVITNVNPDSESLIISKQLSEMNLEVDQNDNRDKGTEQRSKFKEDSLRAIACREKGCLLAEEGKMSEAVTKWQEGLFFSPDDYLLHELTAQGFMSLDQNVLALKSALRAVEICPTWSEGLLTLARTQRELGEMEESFDTYQRVLLLDKKNAEVLFLHMVEIVNFYI
jgi:tetratricopeptide (TPR) repeat protein